MRQASIAVAVAFLLAGTAEAALFRPVEDSAVAKALTGARAQAHGSDKNAAEDEAYVEQIAQGTVKRALADFGDMQCPISVLVMNPSDKTLWDVHVQIEQSKGSNDGTQLGVNIPVLPAHMQTVVRFDCTEGLDTVAVNHVPRSSDTLSAEVLSRLLTQSDAATREGEFHAGRSEGPMINQALLTAPDDARRELITELLKSDSGKKALLDSLAQDDIRANVMKAAGGQPVANALLEALLQAGNRDDHVPAVENLTSTQCVAGNSEFAGRIWSAAAIGTYGNGEASGKVLAACHPDADAVVRILKTANPAAVEHVLESLPNGSMSQVALASLAGTPQLRAFVAASNDVGKVSAALRLNDPDFAAQILAYAASVEGDAAGAKTNAYDKAHDAWLASTQNTPAALAELAAKLARLVADGNVHLAAMKTRIGAMIAGCNECSDILARSISEHPAAGAPEAVKACAQRGKDRLLDAAWANALLKDCAKGTDNVIRCIGIMHDWLEPVSIASIPSGLLQTVDGGVKNAVEHPGGADRLWHAVRQLHDWGYDVAPIRKLLTDHAIAASKDGNSPQPFIAAAAIIDPQNDIAPAVKTATQTRQMGEIAAAGVEIALAPVPVALLAYFLRNRWRRKGSKIFPTGLPEDAPESAAARVQRGWNSALTRSLQDAARILGDDPSPAAAAARAAVAAILPRAVDLLGSTCDLAADAVATGKVRSSLIDAGSLAVYVAVFPGKHDQPHAFRRHPGFGDGWIAHIDAIREGVWRTRRVPILALIYSIRSDGREGWLMAGYESDSARLLPGALLDPQDAAATSAPILYDRIRFDLDQAGGS